MPSEQGAEQLPLALLGQGRIGQRGPQVRLGGDDPAEPEQPVLQVIEAVVRLGGQDRGLDRELLDRVGEVAAARPGASAAAATSPSARAVIFPCSSAAATAPFSGAGLPGSESARRSPCSVSSSPTTANSSLASPVATVALVMCSADSRSDSSANEACSHRACSSPPGGVRNFVRTCLAAP